MTHEDSAWPPGACLETFATNLRALSETCSEMAERLCWSVAGDHLRGEPDGRVSYHRHGVYHSLNVEERNLEFPIQAALARVGQDARVLVFGIGLGESVVRLLAHEDVRVVAWDRDPWILRTLLCRYDLSNELLDGRLKLTLGADLLAIAADPTIEARVEHPLLARIYHRELEWLKSGVRNKRALLCDGGLYVDSLGRTLQEQGFCVWTVDIERLSEEELEHTVRAVTPELMAAINYRDGLVEFTHHHELELAIWEIDPFTGRPKPPAAPTAQTHVFSYRRENVREFETLGFQNVKYLPLAADTNIRRPVTLTDVEREHYECTVSFVGSSMLANADSFMQHFLANFERWIAETGQGINAEEVLEQILAEQRSKLDVWILPEVLERVAPGFYRWCRNLIPDRDPEVLLGEASAAERRMNYIANLGSQGVEVWGDAGWEHVEEHGVNYRGLASHEHDLTRIYCASKINLDIGRIYQNDIVTMRVFDILACGGFALVEHTEALQELFDVGTELDSFRTIEECCEKVVYYTENPQRALEIAARGFEAVTRRHTFAMRLQVMLNNLETSRSNRELGLAS